MRACFYDTWGFLALANASDPHHAIAAEADRTLEAAGYVVVTSDCVIDEALTGINVSAGGAAALAFVDFVEASVAGKALLVLEVDGARRAKATQVFRRLVPGTRRLSFTDCTSFALMRELKIAAAFTADQHFRAAGGGVRPLFELRSGVLRFVPPPLG